MTSSPTYLTEQQLADRLQIELGQVQKLRRAKGWPHMLFGRNIRYTEAQVAAIEKIQTVRPSGAEIALRAVQEEMARNGRSPRRS